MIQLFPMAFKKILPSRNSQSSSPCFLLAVSKLCWPVIGLSYGLSYLPGSTPFFVLFHFLNITVRSLKPNQSAKQFFIVQKVFVLLFRGTLIPSRCFTWPHSLARCSDAIFPKGYTYSLSTPLPLALLVSLSFGLSIDHYCHRKQSKRPRCSKACSFCLPTLLPRITVSHSYIPTWL